MEEDRDLEELVKAIQAGDRDRAIIIAKTLFKRRVGVSAGNNPDPPANINWFGLLILAIIALSPVIVSLAEWWLKNRKKREVEEIYA
jgi:hypothetical protein